MPEVLSPAARMFLRLLVTVSFLLSGAAAAFDRSKGGFDSRCPAWCIDFECDGSAWCKEGKGPSPCALCPHGTVKSSTPSGTLKSNVPSVEVVHALQFELTIPPYVGAGTAWEAREKCAREGGHLVSITDAGDNEAAKEMILKYKRDRATIGAERVGGGWGWHGSQLGWSYQNWAFGQPDSAIEDCVEMWTTGKWNDVRCADGPRAYLCEVGTTPPCHRPA